LSHTSSHLLKHFTDGRTEEIILKRAGFLSRRKSRIGGVLPSMYSRAKGASPALAYPFKTLESEK